MKIIKALPVGSTSWDIVGSVTGKFFGSLTSKELVDRLLNSQKQGEGKPITTTPSLDSFASPMLEAELKKRANAWVQGAAGHIHLVVSNAIKKGTWGIAAKQLLDDHLDSYALSATNLTSQFLGGTPKKALKDRLTQLGLNVANPCPNKPEEPEAELDHTPPDEVDTAALSFTDKLMSECEDATGKLILQRAKAYLENIEEALDVFRLPNAGVSTRLFNPEQ